MLRPRELLTEVVKQNTKFRTNEYSQQLGDFPPPRDVRCLLHCRFPPDFQRGEFKPAVSLHRILRRLPPIGSAEFRIAGKRMCIVRRQLFAL